MRKRVQLRRLPSGMRRQPGLGLGQSGTNNDVTPSLTLHRRAVADFYSYPVAQRVTLSPKKTRQERPLLRRGLCFLLPPNKITAAVAEKAEVGSAAHRTPPHEAFFGKPSAYSE